VGLESLRGPGNAAVYNGPAQHRCIQVVGGTGASKFSTRFALFASMMGPQKYFIVVGPGEQAF